MEDPARPSRPIAHAAGRSIPATSELALEYNGKDHWFCGEGCLLEFRDDPERRLAADCEPPVQAAGRSFRHRYQGGVLTPAGSFGTVCAMIDLYEVLQVHRRADPDVIRAAYRVLARKHHPDFGGDPARMVGLNAAWRVLSDGRRRNEYDEDLRKSRSRRATDRPTPAPIASYGPSARATGPMNVRDSGTVIDFGRYSGWSVGRLVTHDPDYLEWLARTPIGRRLAGEIEAVLAQRAAAANSIRPTGTSGHRGRN